MFFIDAIPYGRHLQEINQYFFEYRLPDTVDVVDADIADDVDDVVDGVDEDDDDDVEEKYSNHLHRDKKM